MRNLPLTALAISTMIAFSCAGPPRTPDTTASSANPVQRIQALPPADESQLRTVQDKDWKNPYVIIRVDGIALLDPRNNEQKILAPDDLLATLAELPPSAWPYGRAVAIAENATTASEDDKVRLRKNRALAAGALENSHVLIRWVPSP